MYRYMYIYRYMYMYMYIYNAYPTKVVHNLLLPFTIQSHFIANKYEFCRIFISKTNHKIILLITLININLKAFL